MYFLKYKIIIVYKSYTVRLGFVLFNNQPLFLLIFLFQATWNQDALFRQAETTIINGPKKPCIMQSEMMFTL